MEHTKKSANLWNALLAWAAHACGSSDRQLSRLMGKSTDYAGYLKRRRKKSASLEETLRLVAAIGLPDWAIFGKLFPQPARPSDLLQKLGERVARRGETPPLLEEATAAWQKLAGQPFPKAGMPRLSLHRRLLWLDEQRAAAPEAALAQLESQIAGLLSLLEPGEPTPDLLGDLGHGLALYGDAQRLLGRADLAFAACRLALDFAEISRERWALAYCLWMSALLIGDQGFPELGLPWLERAAALFAFDHHHACLPELLVAEGQLLLAMGREEQGVAALHEALKVLPAPERRWRHTALRQLAAHAEDAGRPTEALASLDVLLREFEEEDRGLLHWRRAVALMKLDALPQGLEAYGKSLGLVAEHGDPADAVEVLCDLAEILLNEGRREEAGKLAAELLRRWNGRRDVDPKIAELVEDLHALPQLRRLALRDVEETRSRLADLGRRPRPL